MASGVRAPVEYCLGLTIDEATYPIRMFGRGEADLRAKLEVDFGRRLPRYHRRLDEDQPVVWIDWSEVKEWSISTPTPLQRRSAERAAGQRPACAHPDREAPV